MISAIFIDDEKESIDDLIYLLKKLELPLNVIATATSGEQGLVAILKHKPQLVFLDVVMPGMSGFEMLDLLPKIDFHLIITTSVDKYAVQAIRASALDFLLKPIKESELKDAFERFKEKVEIPEKVQINLLKENLIERTKPLKKIAISSAEGIEMINIDNILYFESEGNYTTIHLIGEKRILSSKSIGKFEEIVENSGFFRAHNSVLVNLYQISKFVRTDGGYILLTNGKSLPVARSRKEEFMDILSRI